MHNTINRDHTLETMHSNQCAWLVCCTSSLYVLMTAPLAAMRLQGFNISIQLQCFFQPNRRWLGLEDGIHGRRMKIDSIVCCISLSLARFVQSIIQWLACACKMYPLALTSSTVDLEHTSVSIYEVNTSTHMPPPFFSPRDAKRRAERAWHTKPYYTDRHHMLACLLASTRWIISYVWTWTAAIVVCVSVHVLANIHSVLKRRRFGWHCVECNIWASGMRNKQNVRCTASSASGMICKQPQCRTCCTAQHTNIDNAVRYWMKPIPFGKLRRERDPTWWAARLSKPTCTLQLTMRHVFYGPHLLQISRHCWAVTQINKHCLTTTNCKGASADVPQRCGQYFESVNHLALLSTIVFSFMLQELIQSKMLQNEVREVWSELHEMIACVSLDVPTQHRSGAMRSNAQCSWSAIRSCAALKHQPARYLRCVSSYVMCNTQCVWESIDTALKKPEHSRCILWQTGRL